MVKSKNVSAGRTGKDKKRNRKEDGRKGRVEFRPKEKLIKFLIENKGPVSIKQASEAIAIDYKNVYGYVEDLTASGAIVHEVMGNARPIKISLTPDADIYSVERKRTSEFLEKNPKIKVIKSYIEDISYPFMIVLVFGSYAKGKETNTSDIDICIISDNEDKSKELIDKLNILSLKLEIQEFTTKEFIPMIEKNQRNVGHEIVKNNVILFGIENYYNLISKWMKKE
jgi:predicted nucleotidyltransferase